MTPRTVLGRASVLLVGIGLAVSGCGSERSAERFCDTLRSEKARILEQLDDSANADASDPLVQALSGLGASVQALGELRTYFAKLADAAPEEVRTEAEIVAEQYDRQLEAASQVASDPLGGITSALIAGLTSSGQVRTLDAYARENCGESL